MTTLMKTLIERLWEIPEDEQEKYAAAYLKELEAAQRWEDLFEQTTEDQWETLAEEAQTDVEEEKTVPLGKFLNEPES